MNLQNDVKTENVLHLPNIYVGVLLEALGIFFGLDVCPHLIIPVT